MIQEEQYHGNGENCGNVTIKGNLTVYAYGGQGGSGGDLVDSSVSPQGGGGGGGYPAAGIGGGGAGGSGGGTNYGGAGFTSGAGEYTACEGGRNGVSLSKIYDGLADKASEMTEEEIESKRENFENNSYYPGIGGAYYEAYDNKVSGYLQGIATVDDDNNGRQFAVCGGIGGRWLSF